MSDGGGFGGISLFELFKLEAESHCAALSSGLLALEKAPTDKSVVEPLMRAAHSIKGAGRIIGVDVIVTLAHAMEDCFVAAKNGRETLTTGRVDQLLKAVDVLNELPAMAEGDLPAWTATQAGRIAALVEELKAPPPAAGAVTETPAATSAAVLPAPAAAPVDPAAPSSPASSPVEQPGSSTPTAPAASAPPAAAPGAAAASNVRVAANVLNRMLFLAGEFTVEASRLQTLRELMARLRAKERALDGAIDSLRETLGADQRHAQIETARATRARDTETPLTAIANASGQMQGTIVEQSMRFEETFRRVEELSGALYNEVLRSRMRPFSEGITAFPRMVRDISRQLGKKVELRVEGETVAVDRDILQKLESPLTHMIRNSLDHGVEPPADRAAAGKPELATITLAARHQSGMLVIEVRDDGRGIDPEAIRRKVVERKMVDSAMAERLTRAELLEFPFLPGFSTKQAVTEISGRGVGLDVVQSMVQEVSGTVALETEPGRGAKFIMRLPVTRSVIRAALVRVGTQLFAVPLARLHRVVLVARSEVQPVQGRLQFMLEEQSVGLVQATDMLGGEPAPESDAPMPVLVIGDKVTDTCGLIVDEICGEEDLVVRSLDARLGNVAHIAAAAIRADGVPVFVVDVDDLWRSVKQMLQDGRPLGIAAQHAAAMAASRLRILVVDDSITVREVERQLLLRRGYDVDVAVDGKDGFNALRSGRYDLLVTDVDMPRMTGIELVRAVRREPKLAELPIIIVSYKDREEDRMMGMEAGASAYLTKSSFQDDSLIRMVEDLIGAPT